MKTRYFYDTEFLEDGKTIEIISIGIICEDGRNYYAVNADADWARIEADGWLVEHVLPQLAYPTTYIPKWRIAAEVREFLLAAGEPELWAWYAAYDHVALAQLWGKMIDLPEGIPMWTNDFKQEVERRHIAHLMPKQEGVEHNALLDAEQLFRMWIAAERIEDDE